MALAFHLASERLLYGAQSTHSCVSSSTVMLHSSHFVHYCGHAAEPAEATTPEQCIAVWPEHSLRHLELCAAACLTTDLMVEEPYLCSVDSLLIGQNIPEAVAGHDHHGVLRQQLHSPDIWRAFDMSAAP